MNRDIIGILHEVLNIVKKFKMAAVSKQEYLKRYLSNADSGEKKKRKKKVKVGVKTGKSLIIDDDVNLRDIKVRQDSETGENLLDLADETPLIFNETGTTVLSKDLESIKKKEDEKKAMWAPVKTFQDEIPAEKRDQNAKDLSPRRSRVRHDSSSPERNSIKEKLGHSEDLSPRLRTRHDSASDQSPPRRTRHDSSSDQSPPRNKPTATQQRKTHHDSVDLSPPRRGNRRLTSPDQSPPRRHRHDSSSDQYPPRIARPSANRPKRTRHDSPDLSPPRKTRGSPPDQSPSRRQSAKRAFKGENDNDQSPPRKQKSSERKAGLHSAAELRQENEKTRQRENEMFAKMHANATGRGAETVHRDKSGRKRDFKVEEAKKKEDERKKEEENEKFMEWGKGVKQSKSEKDRVQDDLYEMSKPLARYKNDADLDQMLKERERAEDPMLAFMQKKKAKQNVIAGKKEKPKYKGPAPPPNRFNIPPGYRWDGVDRSNGFEKKRFSMLANKGATREEAYKWSTEDM